MEALLLADLLRNTGQLWEVLVRAANVFLGSSAVAFAAKMMDDSFRLPGKSRISAYRLSLDAAYCK
eukprot:4189868-Heterocapsa_arctica.AAC.1